MTYFIALLFIFNMNILVGMEQEMVEIRPRTESADQEVLMLDTSASEIGTSSSSEVEQVSYNDYLGQSKLAVEGFFQNLDIENATTAKEQFTKSAVKLQDLFTSHKPAEAFTKKLNKIIQTRKQVITHLNSNDAAHYKALHTIWLREFFAEMNYITDEEFNRNSKRTKIINATSNSFLVVGFAGCIGIPLANALSTVLGFLTPAMACATGGAACAASGCACATGAAICYAQRKNISPRQQNQEAKLNLLLKEIVTISPTYNIITRYTTPVVYKTLR